MADPNNPSPARAATRCARCSAARVMRPPQRCGVGQQQHFHVLAKRAIASRHVVTAGGVATGAGCVSGSDLSGGGCGRRVGRLFDHRPRASSSTLDGQRRWSVRGVGEWIASSPGWRSEWRVRREGEAEQRAEIAPAVVTVALALGAAGAAELVVLVVVGCVRFEYVDGIDAGAPPPFTVSVCSPAAVDSDRAAA